MSIDAFYEFRMSVYTFMSFILNSSVKVAILCLPPYVSLARLRAEGITYS